MLGYGYGRQSVSDPGIRLLDGLVAPTNLIGKNGDFYLNKETPGLYGPKVNGNWPSPIPLAGTTVTLRRKSTPPFSVIVAGAQIINLPAANLDYVELYVNGQLQPEDTFTQNGAAITIKSSLGLLPGDKVEIEYALSQSFSGEDDEGFKFRSGMGPPDATIGNDDDFYLDRQNSALYGPKSNGSWPYPTPLGGATLVNRRGSTTPFTATAAGAQTISLPYANLNNVELYLNGQLQPETMFSVSGTTANVSVSLGVLPGDSLEFEYSTGYFIQGGSQTISVPEEETPVGQINGANTNFTLAYKPIINTLNLFSDGKRLTTAQYMINETALSLNLAPTQTLSATYSRYI